MNDFHVISNVIFPTCQVRVSKLYQRSFSSFFLLFFFSFASFVLVHLLRLLLLPARRDCGHERIQAMWRAPDADAVKGADDPNTCQIKCQNRCQIERQKQCQNKCLIECQKECHTRFQEECQIECRNKYARNTSRWYVGNYVRLISVSGWVLEESQFSYHLGKL